MQTIEKGHIYSLDVFDNIDDSIIEVKFFNREAGHEHSGTNCQEVLRMLIDRVNYLDEQLPWKLNKDIIHHLRMAMVLFEARALIRKQEKNYITVEKLKTGFDGHLIIKHDGDE